MYRVCVLFFVVMCAEAKLGGGAFFCRDPDTGKLYAINSTWRSNSFCGNYHCKLRKKNFTGTEYAPLRQLNITNVNISSKIAKEDESLNKNSHIKTNPHEDVVDILSMNNMTKTNIVGSKKEQITITRPILSNGDRYLTKSEIETISSILRTVKKSDLDSIIQMYNLARDIYREIDKTSEAILLEETFHDKKVDKSIGKSTIISTDDNEQVSYWYEPGRYVKHRDLQNDQLAPDLGVFGSTVLVATTPKPLKSTSPVIPAIQIPFKSSNSFFSGTLTEKDFGKLPYYYSMSNFQRAASYVHQPLSLISKYIRPTNKIPPQRIDNIIAKYHKDIKPSVYLPYPFSHITHNNTRTISELNFNNKQAREEPKFAGNADMLRPVWENYQEINMIAAKKNQNGKTLSYKIPEQTLDELHDWQTDPISQQILKEARAHLEEKTRYLKPLYLRKLMTLDRIANLMKLDDLTRRNKRVADEKEPELYEVYLEMTTCHTNDTIPGFFRYGNITEPFPNCCPQRIL